ncbi:enoyl-CoA hydratase/isomerase family protein [Xylophilus rhododendri]|uniref:Enoyl-CoA hydratase/isomerase family protein n=1 Tax=Xylophilus rhododendri TaxID=2697032 RepID=A0A857JBD1_9BURK|nr:enoyl-CoA hydratase/isomerase family protein [Xylophilus rhododendri]QHJ00524.1 enoyl-CoA hydratase/isomerase family protein [Xylophilus rhododendri]
MEFQTLQLSVDGGVAVLTLARPPVNAQNALLRAEITQAFDMLNDSEAVRCIVLTGQGSCFSAGADLKDRPSAEEPGAFWRHNRHVRESFNAIAECSKPTIAAINGAAIGAGFALAVSCDIWLAADSAYVQMPEINVGLAGGAALLQGVFGKSRARRMFFTGMKVTAQELYRLGLVEACVPAAELMPQALAIAREIAAKSPTGLHYAKEAMRLTAVMPEREGYRHEQNMTHALSRTADSQELRAAFLEKRAPRFDRS